MMRFSEDEVLPFDGIPDQSSNVCGLVGILKIFVYFFFFTFTKVGEYNVGDIFVGIFILDN